MVIDVSRVAQPSRRHDANPGHIGLAGPDQDENAKIVVVVMVWPANSSADGKLG